MHQSTLSYAPISAITDAPKMYAVALILYIIIIVIGKTVLKTLMTLVKTYMKV